MYTDLLVYRLSITIFDGTLDFCKRFMNSFQYKRTVEQMIQAARSGKQNIVEGSLEKSVESNLKLTGVARASFGELLEDYKNFLRQRNLVLWDKSDSRIIKIGSFRESTFNSTNLSHLAYWASIDLSNSTNLANLMICLIYKETYLLDQLLRALQNKFIKEGGFRENLFKKRLDYRKNIKLR